MAASSLPASEVDPAVWRGLAGVSTRIPPVNSSVYYFPQGHLEHCFAADSLHNHGTSLKRPVVPSQVLSIRLLSHPISDEAFAEFVLQPLNSRAKGPAKDSSDENESDVASFVKVLTPSDANNGGGFSVPRSCADLVFPRLDFAADPPVQTLKMRDTHNNAWEFRHIYRGTPRRHLLTTGWSRFVNAKRLIAGDSVVFMRKRQTNELFIGVRRVVRIGGNNRWDCGDNSYNCNTGEALKAMESAANGMPFVVVYYPRVGLPDFVVSTEKVDSALRLYWRAGIRVKMAVEAEDSSRVTSFHGTVATAALPDCGPWRGSPWRMLQVTWDEPEIPLNMNRVNLWEVEYLKPTSEVCSVLPPLKKIRTSENPGMLTDGAGEICFPLTQLTADHIISPVLDYSPCPVGMQGARPDQICTSHLSNSHSNGTVKTLNQLLKNETGQEVRTASNVQSIGSPVSHNVLPGSQNGVHFRGADPISQQGHSSSFKIAETSFQLFGKTIQIPNPAEGDLKNHFNCTEGERKEVNDKRNATNSPPHHFPGKTSAAESVISKEPQP